MQPSKEQLIENLTEDLEHWQASFHKLHKLYDLLADRRNELKLENDLLRQQIKDILDILNR